MIPPMEIVCEGCLAAAAAAAVASLQPVVTTSGRQSVARVRVDRFGRNGYEIRRCVQHPASTTHATHRRGGRARIRVRQDAAAHQHRGASGVGGNHATHNRKRDSGGTQSRVRRGHITHRRGRWRNDHAIRKWGTGRGGGRPLGVGSGAGASTARWASRETTLRTDGTSSQYENQQDATAQRKKCYKRDWPISCPSPKLRD